MRVTGKMLTDRIRHANRLLNRPEEPFDTSDGPPYKANPGNLHVAGAYSGWKVFEMLSEGGAVRELWGGYVSKRALLDQIDAFIVGVNEGLNMDNECYRSNARESQL